MSASTMEPGVAFTTSSASPREIPGELVVLDLEGAGMARPALLAAARIALRSAAGRARAPTGGGSVTLLLHGDTGGKLDHGTAAIVTTGDALCDEGWKECQLWIDTVSKELVHGSGRELFPSVSGVHLGEMLLLSVQTHLLDFAYLGRALIATIRRGPPRACRIISADPDRAAALEELVRSLGVAASSWSMTLMPALRAVARGVGAIKRRGASLLRRDAAGCSSAEKSLRELRPIDVLEVAESTPMDQMFECTEREYGRAGVSGVVRLQFGRGPSVRFVEDTRVLELGRPGVVPARRGERFRAHYRARRAMAGAIQIRRELAGAPLRAPVRAMLALFAATELDRVAEHIEFAETMIDASAPRLIVVGNDRWWVGQAFAQIARRRGIPSLCMQDGLASDLVFWWWSAADFFAASAPVLADSLLRHGMPPGRVVVTGQPRYDRLAVMRDHAELGELRASQELVSDRTYVLFATQPHHDLEYVGRVLEGILSVPDVHVILRPHPTEPAAKYAGLASTQVARVTLRQQGDIFTLLACADILVTEFSTVVLEGAVLGKPAITASFDGQPPRGTYAQRGLAISTRSPAELTQAVQCLTSRGTSHAESARREEGLRALLGPVDGQSSRRAAEYVAELLSKLPPSR